MFFFKNIDIFIIEIHLKLKPQELMSTTLNIITTATRANSFTASKWDDNAVFSSKSDNVPRQLRGSYKWSLKECI